MKNNSNVNCIYSENEGKLMIQLANDKKIEKYVDLVDAEDFVLELCEDGVLPFDIKLNVISSRRVLEIA